MTPPNWSLPTQLVLFGQEWTIVLAQTLAAVKNEYGYTDFWAKEISINAGLSPEQQWATLIHEVLHVIDDALSLNFSEETVRRLDAGLWEFLHQTVLTLRG